MLAANNPSELSEEINKLIGDEIYYNKISSKQYNTMNSSELVIKDSLNLIDSALENL